MSERRPDSCPPELARRIDRLLLEDDLSAEELAQIRRIAASDPAARARYDRIVLASRMLDGGPEALDSPSRAEIDRAGRAVMERVRLVPDAGPARRSWLHWLAGLVAVGAAVAVGLPWVLRPTDPRADEAAAAGPAGGPATPFARTRGARSGSPALKQAGPELQARGAPPRTTTHAGIRAFCLAGKSIRELTPSSAGSPGGCPANGTLKLAYTNRSELSYLFLVGIDAAHRLLWYEPAPPRETSIAIERRAEPAPIGRAVRLAINHRAGALRVFGIFSARPIARRDVQRAVESLGADEWTALLAGKKLLPIDDTVQRSVLVELRGPAR